MQLVLLYLTTGLVFLAIDVVGLKFLIRPVFERHVGHLLADPFRLGAAGVFYLGYIAGVMWFAALPAFRQGEPGMALVNGVLLGLLAYGTYEFTNYATLRDWSAEQVLVDVLWGGALTGTAAWAGVVLTRWIT